MSRIILLIIFLGISLSVNSQDAGSERKARKALKEAEKLMNYEALGASLEKRKFVIEMEYLLTGSGNTKRLNQMLNSIIIDNSTCVWQSEYTDIFTDLFRTVSKVEGSVDDWKLTKDNKRLSYFLDFKMFTDNGLYYVNAKVDYDKTISGTITAVRDRLNFSGRVVMH